MAGVSHAEPVIADEAAAMPEAVMPEDSAEARRGALRRKRQHEDEELDEALIESFPCSDPPATWAGP